MRASTLAVFVGPCFICIAGCSSSTPSGSPGNEAGASTDAGHNVSGHDAGHDSGKKPQRDAGKDSGNPADVGPDVIIDPMNCVPFGTKPNSQGIGGYCSPGGGQCMAAGPDASGRLCTADIPGTPAHAWFCTYPCTASPPGQCGTGATCVTETEGSGCVPLICGYLADGGLPDGAPLADGGVDAAQTHDAGSHDAASKDARVDAH